MSLNTAAVAQAVTAARLPRMSIAGAHTEAGGLMSYDPNFPDLYRRAAMLADRLLRGEPAARMPIEQPTRFGLMVKLRTARLLGLTLPQPLLPSADRVVE